MNYDIEAKETWYAGQVFRSQLEARWASVFDMLGWRWQYEPKVDEKWIPDFRLFDTFYAEIKPAKFIAHLAATIAWQIQRTNLQEPVLLLSENVFIDNIGLTLWPWKRPDTTMVASCCWAEILPVVENVGDPGRYVPIIDQNKDGDPTTEDILDICDLWHSSRHVVKNTTVLSDVSVRRDQTKKVVPIQQPDQNVLDAEFDEIIASLDDLA